jgi:CRISPR-associated protein Csx17
LAVNLLGVNRGVASFVRYGFLKRNGLAFLATPLGRVEVRSRPTARLLEDPALLEWLDRLRRACSDKEKTPVRYQAALRQIDRAIFEFANRSERGNDASYLLNVLIALGKAERTLSGGLRFVADKYVRPLQGLNAEWLQGADDQSIEFRLAAALAGVQGEREVVSSIRAYIEPVECDGKFVKWLPGSTSAVWSNRPLVDNLAAVFRRRQLEAFRNGRSEVPLRTSIYASLSDVVEFLNADVDEEKLTALLWAMTAVEFSNNRLVSPVCSGSTWEVPFEFGLLRLLVESTALRAESMSDGEGTLRWTCFGDTTHHTAPDPDVFSSLLTGRPDAVAQALTRAAQRLRSGGLSPVGYRNRTFGGTSLSVMSTIRPKRLLAALLFPLPDCDLQTIANQILHAPENEESSCRSISMP